MSRFLPDEAAAADEKNFHVAGVTALLYFALLPN
jgi:hypothetical protein